MVGDTQPLIAWESLPAVAQTALDSTDFGDVNVPFKVAKFGVKPRQGNILT
ncbi:uncharacterized protein ACLA_004620 [Aspergillus clavatus NRRL 1]|uniref:Uncharacterized protein n=1 Tax=Aspergillus clavatus (strain ATCC 1007 / CBS 513.65 / DSM 816 / NCTC 3887 / NRRL 1 / QM 1276 / 107) TaxID=344612 RepID=A1C5T0_ASPCL|nr:uncharacterized protein ACLA_004620 [Aspergillus clavatus NRRL 1]EAW15048.1 hypothetical protein ACLA_004620 [Aspergillus clavatus NRRL 1]